MATGITRPALVIGLGGTGQWILTFLKKDLLEYNQGVMPSNVKLLAFDTIAQPQAKEKGAAVGGGDEIRIGGIELRTNDEFIHLGKNNPDIFHWAEGIVNSNKHSHISSWFQAEEYVRTLPKDAFNLSTGAGQIRQFGRMAIINDLGQPGNSSIWSRIREEMKKIGGGAAANNKLEVIIAGSFAGGTGAGMFIDMAILLRKIAQTELGDENKFIVRGFFVLPSAFGLSGQDAQKLEMQARSFAAWRELDRFMIKSPNFGVRHIQYHGSHSSLKAVPVNTRPFDACYLIDSSRPVNSLDTVPPDEGIYPSVADVISAILDPVAGKHYTEHITQNLNPIYVANPDTPMYSAVGSYTVKVPIYYTMEEIVHLFAVDALNIWLEPIKDNKDRITKISAAKNEEQGVGTSGLEEALPFLQRTRVTQGDIGVSATLFFNHIADIVTMESIKRGALATRYARPKGAQHNLLMLTNLGDGTKATQIKSQIKSILEQRLAQQVPLSREIKGEDPRDGIGRIENGASQFLKKRFGRRLDDGSEVRGEYGDALGMCRYYQRNTFRKMLAMYVQNSLMGESESDPLRARRGKLGYTYDLVRKLVEIFDVYIDFLNDVEDKRQEGGASQKIYKRFEDQQRNMRDKSGNRILFGILPAPKAHKAQESFIKAGQALADMRRDDLLLMSARESAEDLRTASIEMRDKLYNWIVTLAIGTDENPSLYQRVYGGLEYLRQGRDRDAALHKVQKVLGQSDESELYVQDISALQNILRRINWTVEDEVEMRANEELHDFVLECVFLKSQGALSMQANNMRNIVSEWLASSRKEYEYIPSQKRIADVLVEEYGERGASIFASEISDKAEPLWQPEAGEAGAKKRHTFVRVFHESENPDNDDTTAQITEKGRVFLENFSEELGQLHAASNLEVAMVDSADHYKLSLIRSDDCIPSSNFKVWNSLKRAYVEYIQVHSDTERQERSAVMLHIFPAECNVAEFEARWAAQGNAYEVFEPEVVMVMTDKKRAKLFFLAYAVGMIYADRTERAMVLDISEEDKKIFLNVGDEGSSKSDVDDLFKTLDTFVNHGSDTRKRYTTKIPYDKLRPIIVAKAEEDHKSYLKFLAFQAKGGPKSIYARLVDRYKKTDMEKYHQLAIIAKFMFEDEKNEEEQWAK